MPQIKSPSFSLLLVTDRKFKADEPPVPSEIWKIILVINCGTCGQAIIDAPKAAVVLEGTNFEVDPNRDFLGRVEKRIEFAGNTGPEFFYSVPGRISVVHEHCEKPTGLCVPASMVLAVHTPLADYRPGFPMTDTLKLN